MFAASWQVDCRRGSHCAAPNPSAGCVVNPVVVELLHFGRELDVKTGRVSE